MSTLVGEWIRRNSSQDAWRTPAAQPLIGATVIFPQINSQRARSLAAGDRSYAHVGGAAAFL